MISRPLRSTLSTLAAIAILGTLLVACTGTPKSEVPSPLAQPSVAPAAELTSAPAPTPTPEGPPSEREIIAGIQRTLNLYAQAYNDNDVDLLMQTVDQTNAPFRRYVRTRFEDEQQSVLANQGRLKLRVTDITRRDLGFVQAHVKTRGNSAADWLFRQIGDRWVLSEPTVKQLGKREKIESDHFVFSTYHWADDVSTKLMEMMEQARKNVERRLGKVPETKANVLIKPIYGLEPFENSFYLAVYIGSGRPNAPDTIKIYAPQTYMFGFYDASEGWESDLECILTHEYTHLVHTRSFDAAGKMSPWLSEGLAEYVAGRPHDYEVQAAVQSDAIIPIIDTVTPVYKQDLQHMDTLVKDRSLAYGFAYSLVAYIVDKHGGLDGFWKLAHAYTDTQDLPKAIQQAFDVTYEQFDAGWRDWLKERYG